MTPLRIALTVDPDLPTPPPRYGGIERVVDGLARALKRQGHEITLFARAGSTCDVPRVAWPGGRSRSGADSAANAATLALRARKFDLVHSFSRLAYLAPLLPLPIPKLMSYQREPSPRTTAWALRLARGTLTFTAASRRQIAPALPGRWRVVPNAVDLDAYRFREQAAPDSPFVFLGRLEEFKGPHLAIEIARRAGRRLVLAGNVAPEHRDWCAANVFAHVDGERVTYVGEVDDAAKNHWLGRAAALLFPILWEEPFGIVMIEAMACGAPVLALRRGAVAEVVEDGVTGFVRDTVDDLAAAAARVAELPRAAARARVERLYNFDVVADAYLAIYRELFGAERSDAAPARGRGGVGLRTVVSFPGTMAHAQQAALAVAEAGCLESFVTSLNWRRDGALDRALARLDWAPARAALAHARRKSIGRLDPALVRTYPLGETLRLAAVAAGDPIAADRLWDWSSRRFDAHVARRYAAATQVVQAFEYTALETFRRAAERGVARVLHLPSLDSLHAETVLRRERRLHPELAPPNDGYFERRFEPRYARRRAEIALADVILANSTRTARSHIAAGADPAKVRVVPLAAPPLAQVLEPRRSQGPLVAIWAGNFSLGKGAPYLLEALRRLKPGVDARLEVFGRAAPALVRAAPPGVTFHGSRPQAELFAAYALADLLVFPTLCDGFGMVVAEAFAHGLPVLTTTEAGASDLVTAQNGFVVPAADAKALAQALAQALHGREKLAEMRGAALATARARQWPEFRRDLVAALSQGLARAGYSPRYGHAA